jgi:hypothetical protein
MRKQRRSPIPASLGASRSFNLEGHFQKPIFRGLSYPLHVSFFLSSTLAGGIGDQPTNY